MPQSQHGQHWLARAWLVVLGAIIALAGLFFLLGGVRLISLGGSWYFALSGIAIVVSGVLIALRRPSGALLFGLVTLLTAGWAVWDAGLDFWPMISRLLVFGVGASVVALSFPLLRRARGFSPVYSASFGVAALLAVSSAAGFAGMFAPHSTVAFTGPAPALTPVDPANEQKNWEHYGNTPGGSRFVALDQITRDNVAELRVAWTYRTGDTPISEDGNGAEDQLTPLQVGNTVFLCTPHNNVIAIDAETGA